MIKKQEITINEQGKVTKRKTTKKELQRIIEDKNVEIQAILAKHRAMKAEWEKCEAEYNEELEKNDSLVKDLYYERQKTEKYLRDLGELQDKLAKAEAERANDAEIIKSLNSQIGVLNTVIVGLMSGGKNG